MPSQSKLYSVRAIILNRRDQGEADRVIMCLTPDGRFDYLAKGARKLHSRKAGHLELFSTTDMLISRVTGSWDIVSQAEARSIRARLREDFTLGTYARYIAELVIRFFESDTDAQLYSLVEDTLSKLENASNPELLIRWYEQHLLVIAGFRPEWETCVGERENTICRAQLSPKPDDKHPYGIHLERGGALCPDCYNYHRIDGSGKALSPSALSWLLALQHKDYDDLLNYVLPRQTADELARIMEQYIAYHLERRPASLKFIDRSTT
jgi:DNA repair protein RecO (recombination protein O)